MSRRAAIILKCEAESTDIDVAEELHTTRATVGKWRRRFEKSRIAGLFSEPRVGAPRKITDEHVERVIHLTLHTKPRRATHWSRRLLARESGFSKDAIGRIWRTFGIQPHRSETFFAVDRSAVHREGARHRRALHEPTEQRPRALRGREVADASSRSIPAF